MIDNFELGTYRSFLQKYNPIYYYYTFIQYTVLKYYCWNFVCSL